MGTRSLANRLDPIASTLMAKSHHERFKEIMDQLERATHETRDRINAELATHTEEERAAAKCIPLGRLWATLFHVPSPIDITLDRLTTHETEEPSVMKS